MTNEVPDFEKMIKDTLPYSSIGRNIYDAMIAVAKTAYLAGRKAQVKVDAEIARSEHSMPVEQWMQPTKKKVVSNFAEVIAKAIESQVIE